MQKLYDAIIGAVVGDALGVPAEFRKRDTFKISGMTGFGTHNQPAGTWSDDSSMTLATLESIARCGCISLEDIMENFYEWYENDEFTPYDDCFSVGGATSRAIERYMLGTAPLECGGSGERDNGNGALMRLLPVSMLFPDRAVEVACLTHAHEISRTACLIYTNIVTLLLHGENPDNAVKKCFSGIAIPEGLKPLFERIPDIGSLTRDEIKSSGFVVDTLEASLWCLVNGRDYRDVVLTAVNLGDDTDTTACVAGGLAGLCLGNVPQEWVNAIPKHDWIRELCFEIPDPS